ncbi:MAG TPA: hypothetical protein VK653_09780 [Xanthobacteraceae bacterium]|nr:hypothetical protein [Xanthobacteraceae bacterium]
MTDKEYEWEEAAQRLRAVLHGAFAGPPTPLKDIPTRNGESRKLKRKKPQRRLRRQRKNRAA